MLIIQVAAAVLLLLGSALIFKALVEIDAPTRPRPLSRHPPSHADQQDEGEVSFRRAA